MHTQQLPVGWRREVEGSTPAIRLQRPFVMGQDLPKKIESHDDAGQNILHINDDV